MASARSVAAFPVLVILTAALVAVLYAAGVQLLLVASYIVVGWAVGLRFTRESFREAGQALPKMLAGIAMLVASCAGIGWLLTRVSHIDMLTAYFATSPGGADSIAIIAAGTSVDVPFVMATQMSRFVAVLVLGPSLARRASRLTVP